MEKPDVSVLRELTESAARKAQSIGAEVLASHAQDIDPVDPVDLFVAAESVTSDRWYWRCPDSGRSIVSLGILTGTTPPRNVRFQESGRNFSQTAGSATVKDDTGTDQYGPILHAGFSFDPRYTQDRLVWQGFPSTYLLTPRMTVVCDGDRCVLIQNTLASAAVQPDALIKAAEEFNSSLVDAVQSLSEHNLIIDEVEPDDTNASELRSFVRAVTRAESAVQRGEFDVLNIARRRKLTTGGLYRIRRAISYLAQGYPEDVLVAVGRHGSTFIGRSSGYLIQQDNQQIIAETRKGLTRRGDDSDLDSALAEQLLNTPEEVEHHELCVDHLYEAMDSTLANVEASDEPELRSTRHVHHLYSNVQGELEERQTIFDLLGALHPIVESSGMPVDEAFEFIHDREQVDRGWFSAPMGWIDLNGHSQTIVTESAAVVRAPVMQQQRAYIFSIGTVFSGSDPEDLIAMTDQEINEYRIALSQ